MRTNDANIIFIINGEIPMMFGADKKLKYLVLILIVPFVITACEKKNKRTKSDEQKDTPTHIDQSLTNHESNEKTTKTTPETREHLLAIVNSGKYVPPDHPTVSQFRELIEKVKCKTTTQNKVVISNVVAVGTEQINKDMHTSFTYLEFMKESVDVIPPGPKMDYPTLVALYLHTIKKFMESDSELDYSTAKANYIYTMKKLME